MIRVVVQEELLELEEEPESVWIRGARVDVDDELLLEEDEEEDVDDTVDPEELFKGLTILLLLTP
jgi:16S rRNA C967 or C1407 C5-methylase (RsmB/RsmF family)